jgi:two-component system, chemotaxis family, sensor kinase CheA
MNLVSELVTTQARLSLFAEQNNVPELISIAENVEKISRQLRDNTFSICLVPLESIIIRFQRLVRDLSVELKKDILLLTEGTDTELDKSVIESLADPLLHILRNSIDHGIEDEAVRIQKGKPKQGKILLKAFYSGTNVHIQIQDDGAGIHPQKVRQKAVAKGLISAETVLSEKEILELIFMPGFSTAETVTDVSGRGVGMDVVRRKIAELRGEVEVQSQLDKGTTLTIKLPLTLSVVDGLLVKIEDTHFVIPLQVVDKCFEAEHSRLVSTFNNLVTLDNEKVPFFYLRNEFNMNSNTPAIEQIVTVKYEGSRVGLAVDIVIGEYQAVLKPLGRWYRKQDHISGATILGDGTIALVMDTSKMIKQFIKAENITI